MASFYLSGKALDLDTLARAFSARHTLEVPDEGWAATPAPGAVQPAGARELAQAYLAAQVVNYGPETDEKIIRLALLLLVHAQLGQPGPVQKGTLQRLLAFYNREVYPVVYRNGSDATRLAQLCQPLVLAGKVRFQTYPLKAAEVAEMFSWPALPLTSAEIQALLGRPVFSWAQTADLLMDLKPLTNWFIYFDAVFGQVLPEDHGPLHVSLRDLVKNLEETQQALEQDFNGQEPAGSLHTALANLALSLQDALQQLARLLRVLLAGLETMVEPPATATFASALDLAQLAGLQAPKPVIAPEENFSTFLLLETLRNLMGPAQHLAALAFWSFVQADALMGDFLESSTLQAYQQAGLFVPEETVTEQLEKIANFIQTHIPVGAA
jgi:Aromatic amino acid lyase